MTTKIYQIYYNEETRKLLDPAYIPLDNSGNERPEWYEFWPILSHFRKHGLPSNKEKVGFFSPKFGMKMGLLGRDVLEIVNGLNADYDAFILSPAWDQIAYFQNSFEQGDQWHLGISKLTQTFLDQHEIDFEIRDHVSHSHNTVFSNYIVANGKYWNHWYEIAEKFFSFVESGTSITASLIRGKTSYGTDGSQAPTRAFIQERLANIILTQNNIKVATINFGATAPIAPFFFKNSLRNRHLLNSCDLMKQEYASSGDRIYLDMFFRLRKSIECSRQLNTWKQE
jgi:hypothetical protein